MLTYIFSICQCTIRYAIQPYLQVETPTFIKLGKALVDGLNFAYNSSFEAAFFIVKRLAEVPGYQYRLDMDKTQLPRQIFLPGEFSSLYQQCKMIPGHQYHILMNFVQDLYLIEVKRKEDTVNQTNFEQEATSTWPLEWKDDVNLMIKYLELNHPSEITFRPIDNSNLSRDLNDTKLMELKMKDRIRVKLSTLVFNLLEFKVFKIIGQAIASVYVLLVFPEEGTK